MKKAIQWWHVGGDVANVVIAGFILAAAASNLAGEKAARTAFLLGGLAMTPAAIVCFMKGNENEPFRLMEREAEIEHYATVLADSPSQPQLPPSQSQLPPSEQSNQLFDWSLIQTNPDKYAHLAICGGTGDGKSTLIESLIQYLKREKIIAIDPHWKPGNYEGIPTVAKGRNYGDWPCDTVSFDSLCKGDKNISYTEAIAAIESEMDRRYKLMMKGVEDWERVTIILDEYFAFCRSHYKVSKEVVSEIISEARKVGIRLILITQVDTAESMGWKGMAVIKQSLRWVRLGEFAIKFASSIGDEELTTMVKSMPYPMMVGESRAVLPIPFNQMGKNVRRHISTESTQSDSNSVENERSAIAKYLDALYNLPGYNRPTGGEMGGEKEGEKSHPGEKQGEKISPLDDGGEKPETCSGQDFLTSGEISHPLTNPDHNPSDGGVQREEGEKSHSPDLDKAALVLQLRKQGKNKTEIIKALGYSLGKGYQKGKDEYGKIEAYWRELDLW